jgi:hypothetical protein
VIGTFPEIAMPGELIGIDDSQGISFARDIFRKGYLSQGISFARVIFRKGYLSQGISFARDIFRKGYLSQGISFARVIFRTIVKVATPSLAR